MKEIDPILQGFEEMIWWAVNVLKCPHSIGDRVEFRDDGEVKQGTVTSFSMKRIDDKSLFVVLEDDDGNELVPKRASDITRKTAD